MVRYTPDNQLRLEGFETPFKASLSKDNRWVKLHDVIPWDDLAEVYYRGFSRTGRPAVDAHHVIGALILKHKLGLSDREVIAQIRENPYFQYFVGLPDWKEGNLFAPSLFVEIRRRMGSEAFLSFEEVISQVSSGAKVKASRDGDNDGGGSHDDRQEEEVGDEPVCELATGGKLLIDATVCEQQIRYPTDLSLLNEGRELSEEIIDVLHVKRAYGKKPRTYRRKARREFLSYAKRKRLSGRERRRALRGQLQYIRRNLSHIDVMLADVMGAGGFELGRSEPVLPKRLSRSLPVIREFYRQQEEMYRENKRKCKNRIVSIHQPYVRPIVRGKLDKAAEFGAKISVSLVGGLSYVQRIDFDNYNEGCDLKYQVERYRKLHGCYPELVAADRLYGSRENRRFLKERGIRFGGKPLGRPRTETAENREQLQEERRRRREDYRARIPIEGKFGQGKNGYGLGKIRARTKETAKAWIMSIFLVMNILALARIFFGFKKIPGFLAFLTAIFLQIAVPKPSR